MYSDIAVQSRFTDQQLGPTGCRCHGGHVDVHQLVNVLEMTDSVHLHRHHSPSTIASNCRVITDNMYRRHLSSTDARMAHDTPSDVTFIYGRHQWSIDDKNFSRYCTRNISGMSDNTMTDRRHPSPTIDVSCPRVPDSTRKS